MALSAKGRVKGGGSHVNQAGVILLCFRLIPVEIGQKNSDIFFLSDEFVVTSEF